MTSACSASASARRAAAAESARDRRRMPPPIAPADIHLHQHHAGKHQRDAGQRSVRACDEIGSTSQLRLRHHHQMFGGRAEAGGRDRPFDQSAVRGSSGLCQRGDAAIVGSFGGNNACVDI